MIEFIEILCLEDLKNIRGLFITKELMNRGRVSIGNNYFTVKEMKKTYIVTIEDKDKRKIVNSIYSKSWFESNILDRIQPEIIDKYKNKIFV